MKITTASAALFAAGMSTGAFAQTSTVPKDSFSKSTADTQAEQQRSLREEKQVANGHLSRSEVRAEYIRSRKEVAALTGEDSGSAYFAAHGMNGSSLGGRGVSKE